MPSKLVKGQRASQSDVSSAGAGGTAENPPVITQDSGEATQPKGRKTGGGENVKMGSKNMGKY